MKPIKTIFNANALVSVRVYDKEFEWRWIWKDYKKSFWGDTKAGYYYHTQLLHSGMYTEEEIRKTNPFTDYLFENNKVYLSPILC